MTDSKSLPGSKSLPDAVQAWAESVLGPLTVVRDARVPGVGGESRRSRSLRRGSAPYTGRPVRG
ncbi:hypothetical protein [Streptomyces mirabilis]|uniref:hypothetical protein n=1 Tax=Streptomyces mirabilis TaxID=68239 RepID=UPI0036A29FFB